MVTRRVHEGLVIGVPHLHWGEAVAAAVAPEENSNDYDGQHSFHYARPS
jgi:acyl-CoA synthetase (AMP-forming)/AMP-acid ligase II